jgi:hypothetical protein
MTAHDFIVIGATAVCSAILAAIFGRLFRRRPQLPNSSGGQGPRGSLYEVRTVEIGLPRLDPDSPDSCPVPREHILGYVETEIEDGKPRSSPQLRFLRTAKIG